MFERDEKGQQRDVRVDSFPVASELLNELMGLLREHVRATPVLRHKLFQVGWLGTAPGPTAAAASPSHRCWAGLVHWGLRCACKARALPGGAGGQLSGPHTPATWGRPSTAGQLPHHPERRRHGQPDLPQEA